MGGGIRMSMWLAVDPGEETGWALSEGTELIDAGQTPLREFLDSVWDSRAEPQRTHAGPFYPLGAIVCEDWKLYEWKLQEMAWDECRTARGIGALEFIARVNNFPIILQPAAIKEAAIAAGAEEEFSRPLKENRHQNDAKMHRVFYLARNEGKPPC